MNLVIGRRRGLRRDRSMAVRDGARVLAVLSRASSRTCRCWTRAMSPNRASQGLQGSIQISRIRV